ncbi:hypothetical protein CERZMDRAFT_91440 [Cercospora zeae-maydis SCOH1-5]|uniref:Dynein light chain n=1 Tax=Cercospora zeae-maydis SCOH1-5 TaxID=717836 RepID=A0A6A6F5D4_9PEZI|nr:hypothetical protein CERZMDRAFT_91440 [Cercospora zeae-maydis SCOH1-5]
MASNCPIPTTRLRQICSDACSSTISTTTSYEHSQTQAWNNAIIGSVLQQLISESQKPEEKGTKKVGRRGMHSASGAFWNNEKDGMWSYKYEGGEGKGMDIVVSVMWVAV